MYKTAVYTRVNGRHADSDTSKTANIMNGDVTNVTKLGTWRRPADLMKINVTIFSQSLQRFRFCSAVKVRFDVSPLTQFCATALPVTLKYVNTRK